MSETDDHIPQPNPSDDRGCVARETVVSDLADPDIASIAWPSFLAYGAATMNQTSSSQTAQSSNASVEPGISEKSSTEDLDETPITTLVEEDQNWIHGDLDEDDDEIDDNVNDTYSVAFQRRQELRNAPDPTPAEVVRTNFTVIAAVMAGVLVSCVKFLASFFTGSVAMFSEGVHSLVDACNDSLLLIGTRASKKKPDVEHPFGFGRELYFYTFVVSVVIFFFGGGFTMYRGITALIAGGTVVENPIINYVVLLIGIVLEGFSFMVALRDVNNSRQNKPLFEYIRDSKSPTKFTVLLEDTAAELGMIIALAGIFFSLMLGIPQLDSIASIIIGALMAAIAVLLLRETRSLLIGEGLTRDEIEDVVFIVEQDPAVIKCGRVLSMYMGPNDMLLNLDVTFDDELDEGDVLQAIDRIEAELIDDFPQCTSIFVEAESLNQVYRQRHDRRQAFEAEEEDEEERERERERERELEREKAQKKAKKKAKEKAAKKKAKAKKKKKKAKAAAAAAAAAQAQQGLRPDVHLQAQKELLAAHAAAERAAAMQDILYHALDVHPEVMEREEDDWLERKEHASIGESHVGASQAVANTDIGIDADDTTVVDLAPEWLSEPDDSGEDDASEYKDKKLPEDTEVGIYQALPVQQALESEQVHDQALHIVEQQ